MSSLNDDGAFVFACVHAGFLFVFSFSFIVFFFFFLYWNSFLFLFVFRNVLLLLASSLPEEAHNDGEQESKDNNGEHNDAHDMLDHAFRQEHLEPDAHSEHG